ncbi:MAG: peptidylprolyl isomerase [Thaumarchaeota archaeon]|nr:peptidylprolyl isomerase [Nitrososphaerota archaeon]
MVDKPGRRKQKNIPWNKIAAAAVVGLIAVAGGWYAYWNYVYKAPPEYARIDTTYGAIYVELFPACAPQTVANFVSLANSGFYNDLVWHRIVDKPSPFVIQTGDNYSRGGLNSTRDKWGFGGTKATVPLEWCGWLHNFAGTLAMAHTTGTTNSGSQFFINLSNSTSNLSLDGNFTVFGKVISGMGVVQKIASSPICQPPTCPSTWQPDEPLPPVFMNDVVMLTSQQASAVTNSTTTG